MNMGRNTSALTTGCSVAASTSRKRIDSKGETKERRGEEEMEEKRNREKERTEMGAQRGERASEEQRKT